MANQTPTQIAEYLKKQFLNGQGNVTQLVGNYNPNVERFSGGYNRGTDIGVPQGTPVTLPPGNWEIGDVYNQAKGKGYIGNRTNSGYGNSIVARNADTGETFRFSHLLNALAQPGQKIRGGLIGYTGATGNVTGPHLDIEIGGAFTKGLKNIMKSTSKIKLDPQQILQKAKRMYGGNIIGLSKNPELLKKAQEKYGGTIRKIRL